MARAAVLWPWIRSRDGLCWPDLVACVAQPRADRVGGRDELHATAPERLLYSLSCRALPAQPPGLHRIDDRGAHADLAGEPCLAPVQEEPRAAQKTAADHGVFRQHDGLLPSGQHASLNCGLNRVFDALDFWTTKPRRDK